MAEVTLREPSTVEARAWAAGWERRVHGLFARFGMEANMAQRRGRRDKAVEAPLWRLLSDGDPVGYLALSYSEQQPNPGVHLDDLFIEPEYRRRGLGAAALRLAEQWTVERSPRLAVTCHGADPAHRALFIRYRLMAQRMVKQLAGAPALPDGFSVRPLVPQEYEAWLAFQIDDYVAQMAASGVRDRDVARERSEREVPHILPHGLDTPDHSITALTMRGERVGTLWVRHHLTPALSFVFGVNVDAEQRGRGFGRAAMLAAESLSWDSGDHRLGLNVFGHNQVAINLYTSLGYEVVDQNRSRDLA